MIILIGESALDETVFVKITRLCPEAPAPVAVPIGTHYNEGMAGNVAMNIKFLGDVPSSRIISYLSSPSHHKTRFIDNASGYLLLRVDKDAKTDEFDAQKCIAFIEENRTKIKVIVISDYGKGFLNADKIASVAAVAKKYNIPLFLDTKLILGDWSKDVFCVKINEKEYNENLNHHKTILPSSFCKNLVVTLGGNGAHWWSDWGLFYHKFGAENVRVLDVCGAGDTMLAALVLAYVNCESVYTSVEMALKVASYAVTQRGVYCVKQDDLKKLGLPRSSFRLN